MEAAICNMKCVMMTEIQTIEGGQKDVLLRRTNIKKEKKNFIHSFNNRGF